jgi:hypothetical protein
MPFIPYIAYIIFCIYFAYLNKVMIVDVDEKIIHWANGMAHLSATVLFMAIHYSYGLAVLFTGRLVFDVSLNLFRKLPFDYVPENPKSLVDKIEIEIFNGNGRIPKILYLLLIIAFIL